jgi:5-methylcytosine-specific restriction endonuclease McrA
MQSLVVSDINVDHVIPFSWGGGNERANIQVVHSVCNRQKGRKVDPIDLLIYLEDRYMNLL